MAALRLLTIRPLTVELDLAGRHHEPADASLGIQYTLLEIISVRAGASSSVSFSPWTWRDPDISFGLGVRYRYFGCDYGITIPSDDPGLMAHRLSLVLQVGR